MARHARNPQTDTGHPAGHHYGNPPPPPPPAPGLRGGKGGKGGGGGGNGGGGGGKGWHPRALDQAETAIRNALMSRGVDPALALRYSEAILGHQGVSIGKGGTVRWQGTDYKPGDFAKSSLADLLTGVTAQKQNQAVIQSEPGYLQDMAELGLQRDTQQAGIDDQRRRSLLDFGDPRFAGDPTLAAEAANNPFSVQAALARQQAVRNQAVAAQANRSGTLFGGGYQAGEQQAGLEGAAANTDATKQLQDVLAGLSQQSAGIGSAYGVGQGRALLDSQQRLTAQGLLHAAAPPPIHIGTFHYLPVHIGGGGGKGGGGGGGKQPHNPQTDQGQGRGGRRSPHNPQLHGAPY